MPADPFRRLVLDTVAVIVKKEPNGDTLIELLRVATPGGGMCMPGGGTCIPGGGICMPGGGMCMPGGGTCIPGGGMRIPGGGIAIPGGGMLAFSPSPHLERLYNHKKRHTAMLMKEHCYKEARIYTLPYKLYKKGH